MRIISELRSASGITAALATILVLLDVRKIGEDVYDPGYAALLLIVAGLAITTFILAGRAKREVEFLESLLDRRRDE